MLERLEAKINEYIESILAKETLTKEDYDVLISQISKIKYEEQNKERYKAMLDAFTKI